MKNLYQCEKCGSTFDEWGEANKCEDSHLCNLVWGYDSVEDSKYKEGQTFPLTVKLAFQTYDHDNGKDLIKIGNFKFISEDIEAGQTLTAKKQEEDRKWREQWEREKAERKAKEAEKELSKEDEKND